MPQSKLEKCFKFYVSPYLCNYEGKFSKPELVVLKLRCYFNNPSIFRLIILLEFFISNVYVIMSLSVR